MVAVAGMVRIQAQTIRSTSGHFSAFKLLAMPTPMIEVVIECVVDTGMPSLPETKSMVAAVASAANPLTGFK